MAASMPSVGPSSQTITCAEAIVCARAESIASAIAPAPLETTTGGWPFEDRHSSVNRLGAGRRRLVLDALHGPPHGSPVATLYDELPVSLHRVDPRFVSSASRESCGRAGRAGGMAGRARVGRDRGFGRIERRPASGCRREPRAARRSRRGTREPGRSSSRDRVSDRSAGATTRPGGFSSGRRASARRWRLPLDQPAPVSYALERWSVVDRPLEDRAHAGCARSARAWAVPLLGLAGGHRRYAGRGAADLGRRRGELGVPSDVSWFLTFGQGDALSRNAFQLFRARLRSAGVGPEVRARRRVTRSGSTTTSEACSWHTPPGAS